MLGEAGDVHVDRVALLGTDDVDRGLEGVGSSEEPYPNPNPDP